MASILPYVPQKAPQPQKTYPQVNTSYSFNPGSASSVSFSSSSVSNKASNPCLINKQPYLPQSNLRLPSADTTSMNQIFKSLFGSEIAEWSYSEDTLQRAIHLRISQEKTKQEYYKVERLNRNIELMKLAAIAKVPGHLIPCLFESNESAPTQKNDCFEKAPLSPPISSASPVSLSPSPSPVKASRYRHSRGHTISKMTGLRQDTDRGIFSGSKEQNQKANVSQSISTGNPMRNFRFGLGSAYKGGSSSPHIQRKRTTLPPKHQLSPSRIGAHAISSLHTRGGSNASVDLQNLRHGSSHNRTLSLPASVSIPETELMEFCSSGHANENKGNGFKEITIPDLTPKKGHNARNTTDLTTDGIKATDSEEEQDVERLLDCSDQPNNSFLKRRKLINGSPLKEMTLITDGTDNTTINEDDGNGSIIDLSIVNASTFTCSSPIRLNKVEPKTP
ncbi:hypothetical protein PMKS-004002 [Pichia membranifaciens]|uniref:Uncharacterized protein n=1 Tax=Pichia membranifaciens TaxID=4926 RepID=A0A1Q2YLR1_9ASCO|nr:hypothetical protein PMKS-004002 [Pichia membranifaciens]